MNHVHHVHLFASDIEKSLAFYRDAFGGKVVLDENMAGARNVFMRVGTGRIHFYDQVPSFSGREAFIISEYRPTTSTASWKNSKP